MTKGRVVLLVTIFVVLVGLGVSGYWYVTRYSEVRDLKRSQVAMKAGRFEKAAEAAAQHIADYPDDWRGYDYHGRALISAGRYDDARKSLKDAIGRFEKLEKRPGFSVALARTYTVPAIKSMGGAGVTAATIREALDQFTTAETILLAAAKASIGLEEAQKVLAATGDDATAGAFADENVKGGVSLLEAIALCRWDMGRLNEALGSQLTEDVGLAWKARSATNDELNAAALAAAQALATSQKTHEEVKSLLLAVAREDISKESVMGPLVELCTIQNDDVVVGRARKLLDAIGLEKISLIAWRAGMADQRLGNRLAEEVKLAGPETAETTRKSKASADALARADRARQEIVAQLRDAFVKAQAATAQATLADKKAARVHESVIEAIGGKAISQDDPIPLDDGLLVVRNDEATLTRIRGLIHGEASDPAPLASTILITRDLDLLRNTADAKTIEKKREECAKFLDSILSRHPNLIETRLIRANLAIQMSKLKEAREHCDEMKPAESRDFRVKLFHAELLGLEEHEAESIGELRSLMLKFPGDARGYLAFARAVDRSGSDNKDPASTAMRHVVNMDSKHPGKYPEALAFLARTLLAKGHYKQALDDAKVYYEAHRDDPVAIELFVRALILRDQPGQARKVLDETCTTYPNRPDILIAAVAGFQILPDATKAEALAKKIAAIKPTSPRAQVAVTRAQVAIARALMMKGRGQEAQDLMVEGLVRNPDDAYLTFFLGEIHASGGRTMDAMRQFRKAVTLSPSNAQYCVRLAQAYLEGGDPAACDEALRNVSVTNWKAQILRLQTSLLRGTEPAAVDSVLDGLKRSSRSGLPLATVYLRSGKLDECIKVCEVELKKKNPKASPGVELKKDLEAFKAHFLLGQAYRGQGKRDLAIHHLKQLIKISPDALPAYQYLGNVLAEGEGSEKMAPESIASELLKAPGAKAEKVHSVMGAMLARSRPKEAIEWFTKVIADETASEYDRFSARVNRARTRASTGDSAPIVLAIKELDELAANKNWQIRALLDKTTILEALGRSDPARKQQAVESLRKVVELAVVDKNSDVLYKAVGLYFGMDMTDDALAVCEEMKTVAPEDPRPYTWAAEIHWAKDRKLEAIESYRQAVDRDPNGIRVHMDLAHALDGKAEASKALEVLEELETLGVSARVLGIFEQGALFARWGMYAKAVEQFERLRDGGYDDSPRVHFALGQAFAQLGQKENARKELAKITTSTSLYVRAQLLLADLAEGDDRLAILKALATDKRGRGVAPIRQMTTMLQMDQAAGALDIFKAVAETVGESARISGSAEALAMAAELQLGQTQAAAKRAVRMYEETKSSQWRIPAVFLTVDDDPDKATEMLADVDNSGVVDTLIGLIVSSLRNDVAATKAAKEATAVAKGPATAATWHARLEKVDGILKAGPRKRGVPPEYMFLGALAAGEVDKAREIQATFSNAGAVMKSMTDELVTSSSKTTSPAEAARLLRAALAVERGLPAQGRDWAKAVLKARPTCQWAAGMVFLRAQEEAVYTDVVMTLEPKGCLISEMMQGAIAMRARDYGKAADVYSRLEAKDPGNVEMIMAHAKAVEMAGEYPEAIALYRKVCKPNEDITLANMSAANNIAYLVTQAYPKDKTKLGEARDLIAAAMKVLPNNPMLLDTAGWVAHLLGEHTEATGHLRKVVRALPSNPAVHYHLGQAEAGAGRTEMAQWHLKAAVDLGEMMKKGGQYIAPETAEAIRLAGESLTRLK